VLDLPVVCEVARDFIAENGVADRVEAQACNFTRDTFPGDCDVLLEMETQEGTRRLRFGADYGVTPSAALRAEIDQLLGPRALAA